MADIVAPEVRSRMMSGIKGKNTRPEMILRRALHRRGLRFRLHDRRLPGKPDLVFPKYDAVVFIHGCFWHMHGCHLFRWPASRKEFWQQKLIRNRENDSKHEAALLAARWRIGVVWECALKGRRRRDPAEVADRCADWIRSGKDRLEIAGYNHTQ